MKIYISADIEGVNGICSWDEATFGNPRYPLFQKQMTEEVRRACIGATKAGATEIFVKDAHDSALNLLASELPQNVTLHRGWDGGPASMMASLDHSFDAVIFIGYHSPSRSDGNSLSHTLTTKIHHLKINGVIATEFVINAYYAAMQNVPVAFASGDMLLTKGVKNINPNIITVATKEGVHGATVSKHPEKTNQEIEDEVERAINLIKKNKKKNIVTLPKSFDIEIQYKRFNDAYQASFYPGCSLLGTDRVTYHTENFLDALKLFMFVL